MKILLDIDDTSLIYNEGSKIWEEHPRLHELIKKHEVVLFSGNPDIESYARKWKPRGYISKSADVYPKADVFIDNDYKIWIDFVTVKKTYYSIDEFFEKEEKISDNLIECKKVE